MSFVDAFQLGFGLTLGVGVAAFLLLFVYAMWR